MECLRGAAVVTDDSTYLRREFTDGKNLSCFQEMRSGLCQTVYLTCLATCSPHKDGRLWISVSKRASYVEKQGSVDQGSLDVEPEVLIPSLQQVLHTDENVILADTAQEWRLLCTY